MLNRLQVSVPLSGLLFLNEYLKQQDIEQFKSFRPLIGVIISKRKRPGWRWNFICVSVPLSGLLFLNAGILEDELGFENVSVPLSGLLFLNRTCRIYRTSKWLWSFRPLIGVIISKPSNFSKSLVHMFIVSVPLSGLLFLNGWYEVGVTGSHHQCFRPLIGVIISKRKHIHYKTYRE